MDSLDILSDDELRRRLLQYGFPNLPITQTTRKTLIKKLRNHLATTNNSLRKTSTLCTRYSSGEESDSVENAKTRKTRMTVSGLPSGRSSVNQHMPPPMFTLTPKPAPSPLTTYNRGSINTSGGKKSSVYVSPVIINDSDDDEIDWNARKTRTSISNTSKNTSGRNRSDFYTTLDSSQAKLNGSNGYDQDDDDDPNTTSDTTKRLLQLREGNLQRQSMNAARKRTGFGGRSSDYQTVSENDIVFHAEPSLEPAHIPLNAAIKNFINRLDAAYGFKQTFVPMVLVAFLIVFFLLIIFAYVTISPDIENILNPSTTTHVLCDPYHDSDASYTCIEAHSLEPSLNLLKVLAKELQIRAIGYSCKDKSNSLSNIMCVKDFSQHLNENQHSRSNLDFIKNVHNIEYLVDHNKHWGISNVNSNGEPISLDDVLQLRHHQDECFAILKPKLPITCTIYNKIQTFFFIIGTLAVITVVVLIVRKLMQVIVQMKEKRRAQVDHIIREICNALMEKAIHDKENNTIVLNHLRDKIIEPSKRSELAWAWQEAINYLEHNDSRIHFGVEIVNGEDLKVIRWTEDVKNLSLSASQASQHHHQQQQQLQQQQQRYSNSRYSQQTDGRTYGTLKKWMGSAFDKSNKIKDPPTNCLKIRQMFDKYEANNSNLQTIIQDTILLKLRDKNCKIYDIQLDARSCCVYVKCATCADAGIVHEEINGWWLDAGLVVVKFLKQDKYHQRFPSSINASTALHPSSNVYETSASNGHDDYFDDEIDDDFE